MRHHLGGSIDLRPCGESIAPGRRLQLTAGVILNTAGLAQVVPHAVLVRIEGGPTLPVAPVPLYALLKLVAFGDRRDPKHLAGVLHCLEHYREVDEQRYDVEHDGRGVPYTYSSAYLLGVDGRKFPDEPVARAASVVLDRFSEPEAPIVGTVAREQGHVLIEDEERVEIF